MYKMMRISSIPQLESWVKDFVILWKESYASIKHLLTPPFRVGITGSRFKGTLVPGNTQRIASACFIASILNFHQG
jgi:hypothetical protein